MELEKEIQAVKALRMEMEKYKVDFRLTKEDNPNPHRCGLG